MSNTTKQGLEASLKRMMLKKPLDKITIRDITEDCGVSRMAFYYHFKDIYDLVEWACVEDASRALQGKKTYDTWQEGLVQVFEAVLENKPFILNAYRCISRDQMESFLFKLTYGLIRGVVDEKSELVGTSSLWRGDHFGEPRLRVHWVGVSPDHQRRGLARSLVLESIRLYDELVPTGEPPLYLTTQTESWVACGMYLKLGFVPYEGPMPPNFAADPATFGEKNREAWELIRRKLSESSRSRP